MHPIAMPPPRWTSSDQHTFLNTKLEDFTKAQLEKRLQDFWKSVETEWLEQWPIEKELFGENAPTRSQMTVEQAEAYSAASAKLNKVCNFVITLDVY